MIKGLTDIDVTPQLPRIGKLWKGDPKKDGKPGVDTDHFRFTSTMPDVMASFLTHYGTDKVIRKVGEEKRVERVAETKEFRAILPYPTVEENFSTSRDEWGNGVLKHRCDGEFTSHLLLPNGKISREPHPCPGGCEEKGYLYLILPFLSRWGIVQITTGSNNDIPYIHRGLRAIQDNLSNARNEPNTSLAGVPVIVSREMYSTTAPVDGKRIPKIINIIVVTLETEWMVATARALTDTRRVAQPQLTMSQPKGLLTYQPETDSYDYEGE